MKMIHLKHKSGTKVDLHFKGLFVGEESVGLKKKERRRKMDTVPRLQAFL